MPTTVAVLHNTALFTGRPASHATFVHVETFEVEGVTSQEAASLAFRRHNLDDRPRASEIRSLCAGDAVVVNNEEAVLLVSVGARPVVGDGRDHLISAAEKRSTTPPLSPEDLGLDARSLLMFGWLAEEQKDAG